jgi:hypothetical protein
MSEVSEWFEAIGLAQYANLRGNDLDIDLRRQVDNQILKDIGFPAPVIGP